MYFRPVAVRESLLPQKHILTRAVTYSHARGMTWCVVLFPSSIDLHSCFVEYTDWKRASLSLATIVNTMVLATGVRMKKVPVNTKLLDTL